MAFQYSTEHKKIHHRLCEICYPACYCNCCFCHRYKRSYHLDELLCTPKKYQHNCCKCIYENERYQKEYREEKSDLNFSINEFVDKKMQQKYKKSRLNDVYPQIGSVFHPESQHSNKPTVNENDKKFDIPTEVNSSAILNTFKDHSSSTFEKGINFEDIISSSSIEELSSDEFDSSAINFPDLQNFVFNKTEKSETANHIELRKKLFKTTLQVFTSKMFSNLTKKFTKTMVEDCIREYRSLLDVFMEKIDVLSHKSDKIFDEKCSILSIIEVNKETLSNKLEALEKSSRAINKNFEKFKNNIEGMKTNEKSTQTLTNNNKKDEKRIEKSKPVTEFSKIKTNIPRNTESDLFTTHSTKLSNLINITGDSFIMPKNVIKNKTTQENNTLEQNIEEICEKKNEIVKSVRKNFLPFNISDTKEIIIERPIKDTTNCIIVNKTQRFLFVPDPKLRSKYTKDIEFPIPYENLSITRNPFNCPIFGCYQIYFISTLCKHIENNHKSIKIILIQPKIVKKLIIDPRQIHLGQNKCHGLFLIPNLIKGFGYDKYNNYLPILLMSTKFDQNDINKNSILNNEIEKNSKISCMFWLEGPISQEIQPCINLIVKTLKSQLQIGATINLYSIHEYQDYYSVCQKQNKIIVSDAQYKEIKKNEKEMLELSISFLSF